MTNVSVGQGAQVCDEVRVDVDGAGALTGAARDVFDAAVKAFATELLDEASRRELEHRMNTSTVPQYTSAQVAVAEQVVRNKGIVPPSRSPWFIVAKVVIFCFAILVGVASNLMVQKEPWFLDATGWLAVFCVTVTAGIILSIVIEFIEFNKERGR